MPGTVLRPSENKTKPLPSQKAVSRALGVDVDVPITSDSICHCCSLVTRLCPTLLQPCGL